MEKLVSVIVPVYNVEKYLIECIESIINQTYQKIEIILVDDGSKDNSGNICDKYAKKDNRIKVIHKENGGLSDARNVGIDVATGDYIVFVDSDDYIEKTFIEKLYLAIKNNGTKVSQCGVLKINDQKEILNKVGYAENIVLSGKEMLNHIYDEYKHSIKNTVVWNRMYAIDIFRDLKYPVGKIHEDEFVTYKILYDLDKVAIIRDFLYNYRQTENSITRREFNIKRLDYIEALEERLNFFESKKEEVLYNKALKKYMSNLIFYYRSLRKYVKDSKEQQKDLLNKFKKYYKKLNIKQISKKKRLEYLIFRLYPNLLIHLIDIRYPKNAKGKYMDFKKYVKNKIKKIIWINKYKKYKKYCKKNNQKEYLIFNSPIHGNIGDHAIIYAEYKMLEKINIKAFEIPTKREDVCFEYIKNNTEKDSVIYITGGGFIGSQWLREQNLVNKVVDEFSEHKIIIFPQTIYFKDDEQGKEELQKSIQIFNKAKKLNICAREEKTYKFAKETYKNANVILVPDIVLSLENFEFDVERENVLLCLRKDVEGIFSAENKEYILSLLKERNLNIKETDTVVHRAIRIRDRNREFEQKLKEFASAKFVVTDRLHGMIFATITNTPCIVFSNYNHKVEGVYQWIKDIDKNIIFKKDVNNIEKDIDQLLKTNTKHNKENLYNFEKLYKLLEEENG